jgi:hypothetical protein
MSTLVGLLTHTTFPVKPATEVAQYADYPDRTPYFLGFNIRTNTI